MRREKFKIAIVFGLAALVGVYIQFTNPIEAIAIMIICLISAFFSITVLTVGIFSQKFRVWYLVGFVPVVVAISVMTIVRDFKQRKAVEIIKQVEIYKSNHGDYPLDLKDISNTVETNGLNYQVDTMNSNYSISYMMDNFNSAR